MMKGWFWSLNGALTLGALALVTELWRSYLDAMFVLPVDFGEERLMEMAALIFTAVFAAWAWSLYAARHGNRRALALTFAMNVLVLLAVPVGWLLAYCPPDCRAVAGVFNLVNTLNLVSGLLAAVALGRQLWPSPRRGWAS